MIGLRKEELEALETQISTFVVRLHPLKSDLTLLIDTNYGIITLHIPRLRLKACRSEDTRPDA